jgi:hypothetical protein
MNRGAHLLRARSLARVDTYTRAQAPTMRAPCGSPRRITRDRMQAEMEERVPNVNMLTSLYCVQKKYGPLG